MAFPAKYPGKCATCGEPVNRGDMIKWSRRRRGVVYHATCQAPTEFDGAAAVPAEATTGAADATVLDALAQALENRMQPTPSVDEAEVKNIIATVAGDAISKAIKDARAEVLAAAPVVIEVRRLDESTAKLDGAHYLMPRLLHLLAAGIHVYLWGPAGTGKTTAALQAARALGKEQSEIDTLDPSTPKSAIMGYRTPMGEPVHTAFSRTWTAGQVYVGDECDNAPAHVQTVFNSALANHHAPLAWGSTEQGDGFLFVGTGNTPGRATPAFPDRRPMSAAFADRLYFIAWPLDPAIEARVAGLPIPAAPERRERTVTPQEWVTFVQAIRAWAAQNAPTLMVTPRASLVGLQALAAGETPEEVAHGLIFRGADKELVTKALAAVPLP